MNQGVLQTSPVQPIVAGNPNLWYIKSMRPTSQESSPFLPPISSSSSSLPFLFSWHENQELPDSWSQLLLGGLVGEEDKSGISQIQAQKLAIWEEQVLNHTPNVPSLEIKEENSSYVYDQAAKPNLSAVMPTSSPKSCVTSSSNNMLNFSDTNIHGKHPPPDHSSECNSAATGGALKKARVQPSSTQSTFKVKKEKLGDRITALHQLVSPFGKTDTASVLLESIGYISFLHNQIEALSLPYLGSGSGRMRQPESVQRERNCLFREGPGQDSHQEPKKDLRSRGLCLVPISCTGQVGSDNGADYWAPAVGGGF